MGRLRKKPWAETYLKESKYFISSPEKNKGIWNKSVFLNENDIHIEIGHGKGQFLFNNAKKFSNKNFIGIEKYPSVQVVALKKVIEDKNLNNIYFVSQDASNILSFFNESEVSKIFINFPDPWPKERHSKRRLMYRDFLDKYYFILKENGILEFKTDQKNLYYFFLEELNNFKKFKIIENTENFYEKNNIEDCIYTEYEKKFFEKGNNIFFLKIQKKF